MTFKTLLCQVVAAVAGSYVNYMVLTCHVSFHRLWGRTWWQVECHEAYRASVARARSDLEAQLSLPRGAVAIAKAGTSMACFAGYDIHI